MNEPTLPAGIRSRLIDNGNGLRMHFLEGGHETPGRPCVVLLHGFPELAYTWRKIMLPLANTGFHVIAPDQRGFGLTTGWDDRYEADLHPYRMLNLVQDVVGLVFALGYREVAAVIGHDFGSPVAGYCGLVRPDMFRSVALMSALFAGAPAFRPPGKSSSATTMGDDLPRELAALDPPRKHYRWYYSTPEANTDMLDCPQGLHAFLRAYFHQKSADWAGNDPHPLPSAAAADLARMPHYYVMELDKTMAETVAPSTPSPDTVSACRWLPDEELAVYTECFARTGFQGGLNWYRASLQSTYQKELLLFAGRTLDQPSCFIAGSSDWGIYQTPGVFELMQARVCTNMLGCHILEKAGHWVQQEQPDQVSALLLDFLHGAGVMPETVQGT